MSKERYGDLYVTDTGHARRAELIAASLADGETPLTEEEAAHRVHARAAVECALYHGTGGAWRRPDERLSIDELRAALERFTPPHTPITIQQGRITIGGVPINTMHARQDVLAHRLTEAAYAALSTPEI